MPLITLTLYSYSNSTIESYSTTPTTFPLCKLDGTYYENGVEHQLYWNNELEEYETSDRGPFQLVDYQLVNKLFEHPDFFR